MALVVVGVAVFGSGKFLKETTKFEMYFEGSVKGLNVGAPVVFRGVKVGTVTDIQLIFDPSDMSIQIPVTVELEPHRITRLRGRPDPERYLRLLVERGLRARLELQSLVTGQLMVELDFHPDKPVKLVGTGTKYPELPTIPSSLEELSKRIEEVPIEEIFNKLLLAVEGIEKVVNSPKVGETVGSLQHALEDIRKLVRNVDAQVATLSSSIEKTLGDTWKLLQNVNNQVAPLTSSIKDTVGDYGKLARDVDVQVATLTSSIEKTLQTTRSALEQGKRTLAMAESDLGEDSPVIYELDNALKEVAAAARSIRLLTDYLKRHPEALLKGKGTSGGK